MPRLSGSKLEKLTEIVLAICGDSPSWERDISDNDLIRKVGEYLRGTDAEDGQYSFTFADIRDNLITKRMFHQYFFKPAILDTAIEKEESKSKSVSPERRSAFDVTSYASSPVYSSLFTSAARLDPIVKAANDVYAEYATQILIDAKEAAGKHGKADRVQLNLDADQGLVLSYYYPALVKFLNVRHPGILLENIMNHSEAREIFYKSSTLTNVLFLELVTSPPKTGEAGDIEDMRSHLFKISSVLFEMASKKNERIGKIFGATPETIPSVTQLHAEYIEQYCNIHRIDINSLKQFVEQSSIDNTELLAALSLHTETSPSKKSTTVRGLFEYASEILRVKHPGQTQVSILLTNSIRAMELSTGRSSRLGDDVGAPLNDYSVASAASVVPLLDSLCYSDSYARPPRTPVPESGARKLSHHQSSSSFTFLSRTPARASREGVSTVSGARATAVPINNETEVITKKL